MPGWVIVKFFSQYIRDQAIPYDDSAEQHPEQHFGQLWIDLTVTFPSLKIRRAVTSLNANQLIEVVQQAKSIAQQNHTVYPVPENHFLTYFEIEVPSTSAANDVAQALNQLSAVEDAYVEGEGSLPTFGRPGTTGEEQDANIAPLVGSAPKGIAASTAWAELGGDGSVTAQATPIRFADIEQGWDVGHPDLPTGSIQCVLGVPNTGNVQHGSLAIGVVLAQPNGVGCVGIAPNVAQTFLASVSPGNRPTDVANAIAAVTDPNRTRLRSGDILLLEWQLLDGTQILPVEVDSLVFQWIWNATFREIVVVEAAGNGGINLDTYARYGQQLLNRGSGDFQESLAIVVGAAHSAITPVPNAKPRSPIKVGDQRMHNYGSRIDCFAWGDSVKSTGMGATYGILNDTSAAAAIIAGAALSLQGIAQRKRIGDLSNGRFSPGVMRQILRHPAIGTLSYKSKWQADYDSRWDPIGNTDFKKWNYDKIGVMPNLKKAINKFQNLETIIPGW